MNKEVRAYLSKIGSKGGKVGGVNRMAMMTPKERSEFGKRAIRKRWRMARLLDKGNRTRKRKGKEDE